MAHPLARAFVLLTALAISGVAGIGCTAGSTTIIDDTDPSGSKLKLTGSNLFSLSAPNSNAYAGTAFHYTSGGSFQRTVEYIFSGLAPSSSYNVSMSYTTSGGCPSSGSCGSGIGTRSSSVPVTVNSVSKNVDQTVSPPSDKFFVLGVYSASTTGSITVVINRAQNGVTIADAVRVICQCPPGTLWDAGASSCLEVDECSIPGANNCAASWSKCTNTVGSFTCECNTGYTGNGITCNEVNECTSGTHNCDVTATCSNTAGSFACVCPAGYSNTGTTTVVCVNTNECTAGKDNCANTGSTCTDTTGSFTCACNTGYSGTGTSCSNINECTSGTHNCGKPGVTCTDTPGSFTCACSPGFSGDPFSSCVELNECSAGVHNCPVGTSTCSNTVGSFTCSCRPNFSTVLDNYDFVNVASNGFSYTFTVNSPMGFGGNFSYYTGSSSKTLTYTFTSAMGIAPNTVYQVEMSYPSGSGCKDSTCSQYVATQRSSSVPVTVNGVTKTVNQALPLAADTYYNLGSFTAYTSVSSVFVVVVGKAGASPNTAVSDTIRVRCPPFDECANKVHNCDVNATCFDASLSFTCFCNAGYTGSGLTCNDVNECSTSTHTCDANAACSNTVGSFTCTCNTGYTGSGSACANLNACINNPCAALATCTDLPPPALDTPADRTCACNTGYTGDGTSSCTNVNECTANLHSCAVNATCTDSAGSFSCACLAGFTGSGVTCNDVNECQAVSSPCQAHGICVNTIGSFDCTSCETGFTYNPSSKTCDDINECLVDGSCSSESTCINTVGSFSCACLAGFYGDGVLCEQCLPGTYSTTGNTGTCTVCPAGTYNPSYGKTSLTDCTACPSGTYSRSNSSVCLPFTNCQPGTYASNTPDASHNRLCNSCTLQATFSNSTNQAQCYYVTPTCSDGYYISRAATLTSDTVCSLNGQCAAGYQYFVAAATLSTNVVCNDCRGCPPGTRRTGCTDGIADASCVACTSGTFTSTENATVCATWTECVLPYVPDPAVTASASVDRKCKAPVLTATLNPQQTFIAMARRVTLLDMTTVLDITAGVAPYTYVVSNGPAGAYVTAAGVWRATFGSPGSALVTLRVIDSAGSSLAFPVTYEIVPPLTIVYVTLTPVTAMTCYVNTSCTLPEIFSIGGQDPSTLTLATTLPTGLESSIDATSGALSISGTSPGPVGRTTLILVAIDAYGFNTTVVTTISIAVPTSGTTSGSGSSGTPTAAPSSSSSSSALPVIAGAIAGAVVLIVIIVVLVVRRQNNNNGAVNGIAMVKNPMYMPTNTQSKYMTMGLNDDDLDNNTLVDGGMMMPPRGSQSSMGYLDFGPSKGAYGTMMPPMMQQMYGASPAQGMMGMYGVPPNGGMMMPPGAMMMPNGMIMLPNGIMMPPNAMMMPPNGAYGTMMPGMMPGMNPAFAMNAAPAVADGYLHVGEEPIGLDGPSGDAGNMYALAAGGPGVTPHGDGDDMSDFGDDDGPRYDLSTSAAAPAAPTAAAAVPAPVPAAPVQLEEVAGFGDTYLSQAELPTLDDDLFPMDE